MLNIRVIVDHVRMIHTVCIVVHQGTIPTLRDDYLSVRHVDYLRFLVRLFVPLSFALTPSLPMTFAALSITLSLLGALFLRLTQIGH